MREPCYEGLGPNPLQLIPFELECVIISEWVANLLSHQNMSKNTPNMLLLAIIEKMYELDLQISFSKKEWAKAF